MDIRYRRDLGSLVHAVGLKGSAAEIGVAEGFFSADMLSWPVCFPRVYMVDRWACHPTQKGDGGAPQEWHDKNRRAAQERVAQYGARAVILQGDSHVMALHVPDASLALVYIDGDHSFAGVCRDIKAWVTKVEPGGIMAFHDYENEAYGVRQSVEEYCSYQNFKIHRIREDKPEDAGALFFVDHPIC